MEPNTDVWIKYCDVVGKIGPQFSHPFPSDLINSYLGQPHHQSHANVLSLSANWRLIGTT